MAKLEVFFDYACPYCYRGHGNLSRLMEKYPQVEIAWRPCEAHPRPERYSPHSDLVIRGMYFVKDRGGDLARYHQLVYQAIFEQGADISAKETAARLAAACVDREGAKQAFLDALARGEYRDELEAGNQYAWIENRLDAVPSYRSGSRLIGSADGRMVSAQELERFMASL